MKEHSNYTQIYTDGAKKPEMRVTGFWVAVPEKGTGKSRRTSSNLGVYTVEMLAVLVALRWVEKTRQDKVLICSDSSSALASLRSFHSSHQDEVPQSVTRIANQGGQVNFLWIPAHVRVRGNERVDELPKRALNKENIEIQISISKAEVKCVICEKKKQPKVGQRGGRGGTCIKFKRISVVITVERKLLTRLRLGHCAQNTEMVG